LAGATPFLAFSPKLNASSTPQPLSSAVLTAVQSAYNSLLTNINNGTVGAPDFNVAALQTNLLINNCNETGFDATFITALNSIDTSQVDVSANSSIVTQTYQAASAAGTGVSLARRYRQLA
jgi:hypothetical protein